MPRFESRAEKRRRAVAMYDEQAAKKRKRLSARKRGYDAEWQTLRAIKVREVLNTPGAVCPLCGQGFEAHNSKAIHLDHIERIADNPGRRLDEANWRAVHGHCHSRVTAQEDRAKERGFALGARADGMPSDPAHPFNRGGKR